MTSTISNTPTNTSSSFSSLLSYFFPFSQTQPTRVPTVVILGASFAGTTAASELEKTTNVILIDRNDYAYFPIASPRAVVDSSLGQKILVPLTNLLKNGHFIQGEVTEIQRNAVLLNGREQPIRFDYLLVATGYGNTFPEYRPHAYAKDVLPVFEETSKAIKEAKNILVIGGGAVGVELAGEINERYPEKKITLVHPENLLLNDNFAAIREPLTTKIQNLPNVTLVLGDKVVLDDSLKSDARYLPGSRTVKTEQGKSIETDLIFFALGGKPNAGFLSRVFPEKVDSKGQIKVNKYLQVEGFETIFAAGDCTNVPESKQTIGARGQAAHAAKNILALHRKKPLKEYALGMRGIFVTIGSQKGIGLLFGWTWGDWFVSKLKGRTLMVEKMWAGMKFAAIPESFDGARHHPKPKEQEAEKLAGILKISLEEAGELLKGLPPVA